MDHILWIGTSNYSKDFIKFLCYTLISRMGSFITDFTVQTSWEFLRRTVPQRLVISMAVLPNCVQFSAGYVGYIQLKSDRVSV